MKIKYLLPALLLALPVSVTRAQGLKMLDDLSYYLRMDYSLGGTAPVGLPATIRRLDSYSLRPNFSIGIAAQKPLDDRWGIRTGLHFGNKGMKTDAQVKNYHMQIVHGGETLEGQFTGNVVTRVSQWGLTVPVQVVCRVVNDVDLRFGPYATYVYSRRFSGEAYAGYLRVGNPTGPRVELGRGADERGSYDFSTDLRRLQWGLDLGADWRWSDRWAVGADVSWGLSSVFHSDFKTIEQRLYSIFGTVGVVYHLK